MALPTPLTFDLLNTYVHLEAGGNTVPEEVGDDFWTKIAARPYERMRLVCALHMTADSPTWERHPAGDEILLQRFASSFRRPTER